MKRVFNFSGGSTSAYMTKQHYKAGDIVLFQDTGREHPMTYEFINQFEIFEKIPITRIKYSDSDDPFGDLLKSKNFKVIPNRMKRICTVELKINTAKRWLKRNGIKEYENFIGFRYDEKVRVLNRKQPSKKVHDRFPLYEDKVTKNDIDAFWRDKSYRLSIPRILGNCVLCPLKGANAIMAILREFPEFAEKYIWDEKQSELLNGIGNGHTYLQGITIEKLRDIAQNTLFKEYSLESLKPQFNCVCG